MVLYTYYPLGYEVSCVSEVKTTTGNNEDDFHGQLLLTLVKIRK